MEPKVLMTWLFAALFALCIAGVVIVGCVQAWAKYQSSPPKKIGKDKSKHIIVCLAIDYLITQGILIIGWSIPLAFVLGAAAALMVGFARELFGKTKFSWKDILADVIGIAIGIALNLLTL